MKITKQRLKEIIREEFSAELTPIREDNAATRMNAIAIDLGGKEFAMLISHAIASAAGALDTRQAEGLMTKALKMLLQPQDLADDDVEYFDEPKGAK
jgi:hypothetical protein